MGVLPNHPFAFRILHDQPTILGYPHLWNPPYEYILINGCSCQWIGLGEQFTGTPNISW